MELMDSKQARQIWHQVEEKVKDRVINPTVYRALEAGVGVTLDGEQFILGFRNADMPLASHLRSSQTMSVIEKCVSEVLKKKVRVLIIDGITIEEYQTYLKQIELREQTATIMSSRRDEERQIQLAWEEIGEQITRAHARLSLRQLPQTKAIFMKHAFEIINEAVNRLGYTDDADELQKRSLARVFEKFATVSEIPSAMLAYEFFKLREEGKLK
jgi:hypothetical protein